MRSFVCFSLTPSKKWKIPVDAGQEGNTRVCEEGKIRSRKRASVNEGIVHLILWDIDQLRTSSLKECQSRESNINDSPFMKSPSEIEIGITSTVSVSARVNRNPSSNRAISRQFRLLWICEM